MEPDITLRYSVFMAVPCIDSIKSFVVVEEKETNLMSLVIKFYFTSSMLNMFRTLIHHPEPATFLLYHHIGRVFLFRCVLEFRCGWFGVVSV